MIVPFDLGRSWGRRERKARSRATVRNPVARSSHQGTNLSVVCALFALFGLPFSSPDYGQLQPVASSGVEVSTDSRASFSLPVRYGNPGISGTTSRSSLVYSSYFNDAIGIHVIPT